MAVRPYESSLRLTRFEPCYAEAVAEWVGSTEELHRLAPSTEPPLTAAKVIRWPQPGGRAIILLDRDGGDPVAYGELNPMRNTADQYWLGHVIVSPVHRGQGRRVRGVAEAGVDHRD